MEQKGYEELTRALHEVQAAKREGPDREPLDETDLPQIVSSNDLPRCETTLISPAYDFSATRLVSEGHFGCVVEVKIDPSYAQVGYAGGKKSVALKIQPIDTSTNTSTDIAARREIFCYQRASSLGDTMSSPFAAKFFRGYRTSYEELARRAGSRSALFECWKKASSPRNFATVQIIEAVSSRGYSPIVIFLE